MVCLVLSNLIYCRPCYIKALQTIYLYFTFTVAMAHKNKNKTMERVNTSIKTKKKKINGGFTITWAYLPTLIINAAVIIIVVAIVCWFFCFLLWHQDDGCCQPYTRWCWFCKAKKETKTLKGKANKQWTTEFSSSLVKHNISKHKLKREDLCLEYILTWNEKENIIQQPRESWSFFGLIAFVVLVVALHILKGSWT